MFAFAESPIRVGRSPLNHMLLEEHYISRIEGVVRFDAREVTYFNVGRTNITLLNGNPVPTDSEVTLDEGSELMIGKLQLRFSREAVDDAKIIRRAARLSGPDEGQEELSKTAFLDNPWSAGPAAQLAQAQPAAKPSTPAPSPQVAAAAVAAMPSITPSRSPNARPVIPPQSAPIRMPTPLPVAPDTRYPTPSREPPRYDPPATPRGTPESGVSSVARSDAAPALPSGEAMRFSHAEYRRAWRSLLRDIEVLLTSTPEGQRAAVAEQVQRDYPQVIRENEFRELMTKFGLKPRKPGDPELEQWLRSLGKGLFPPGVRLDTGMTIDRLGALLQMFSQVFVEIQAAQNDARKEMAVTSVESSSLLASEDPKVILAYLLNPNVDGDKRMAELEQCVTKLAIHEAALFGAIKDGAQALLEALSPAAVAREEQRSSDDPGMLSRVFASKQDGVDAKLWRRFVAMHENLMDGKQYQRKFIGREFARIYLRALEKLG